MKIGITGYKGRLGSELARQGCLPLSINNEELDITIEKALREHFSIHEFDVVINCAAFTNVDACETEEGWEKARLVNYWGIEHLKRTFPGHIIHISTDYVFKGTGGPYTEKQEYDVSVNSYGMSKMAGEIAFLNPHRTGDILIRTTGLYGRGGHRDLVSLVRETLSEGTPLLVSKNLMGNQTYIPHLAEALINIANRIDDFRNIPILNVASREVVSRYEFALMVASIFGLDKNLLIPVNNKYISNWVAERPTKAGLKVGFAKKMKVPIYTILDGLKELRDEEKR